MVCFWSSSKSNISLNCIIKKNILHIGCIKIELKDETKTLKEIKKIIQNNIKFINDNSSKRGGGWINITTRVLNDISV